MRTLSNFFRWFKWTAGPEKKACEFVMIYPLLSLVNNPGNYIECLGYITNMDYFISEQRALIHLLDYFSEREFIRASDRKYIPLSRISEISFRVEPLGKKLLPNDVRLGDEKGFFNYNDFKALEDAKEE